MRSLRCEWPGCGARAAACDLDHDTAHPVVATCSCNLGALCRRHHRVKQVGWGKARLPDGGVSWRSPTGRSHLAVAQLPRVPTDLQPPVVQPRQQEQSALSPQALLDQALWDDPTHPDWADVESSPRWLRSTPDHDSDAGSDRLGDALREGSTAWTLELADPYRWLRVGQWLDRTGTDGEPPAA